MHRTGFLALAAALLIADAAAAEPYAVGLSADVVPDPGGLRPIDVHMVYPAKTSEPPATIAENKAVRGFEAVRDAPMADGRFPLVIISHGVYGKWSNYGWLARDLAASGMIVALPTHPGTAWTHRESQETPKLWERPRDLSRIIDHLQTDSEWAASTADRPIAAIGHSLGGYTVLAAAGALFDRTRYDAYCDRHPDRGDCHWYRSVGVAKAPAAAKLDRSLADPRIDAIVSLDLGFTQAFDPTSVAAIAIPALVIGAGAHQRTLPVDVESRHLAAMLPADSAVYHEIADISHFSFFPVCRGGAVAYLAGAGEGDEVICNDGGGREREALHVEIGGLIRDFLKSAGFDGGI